MKGIRSGHLHFYGFVALFFHQNLARKGLDGLLLCLCRWWLFVRLLWIGDDLAISFWYLDWAFFLSFLLIRWVLLINCFRSSKNVRLSLFLVHFFLSLERCSNLTFGFQGLKVLSLIFRNARNFCHLLMILSYERLKGLIKYFYFSAQHLSFMIFISIHQNLINLWIKPSSSFLRN